MNRKNWTSEHKRYVRRIWISGAVYAVPLVLKIVLPDEIQDRGVVSFALLVAPMLGMIGFFYAMHRLVAEMSDEYERHVMVAIYQLATWLMLAGVTVAGFLQFDRRLPLVPLFAVPMIWFVCFGIAGAWVRWRERREPAAE